MSRIASIPLLDLKRQTRRLMPELEKVIRGVLARGEFILGPEVARFEKEFARFCSARHGVGVASGTDALELALQALGVRPGDWVATVSFTFLATADAILHVGARPLFVEIDPVTYTMDPADLEKRLRALSRSERKRVKAVLPVHLYGHPCDMEAIRSVARRYGLAVVEDCAQAAGARWKGKPVGAWGDAGCFSFFPSKNLGVFGDAGLVVTSSVSLARKIRSLRVHGRSPHGEFQTALGRNSRLDELQAAILRVKLRKLPGWVAHRQEWARAYTERLCRLPILRCPTEAPGAEHAFQLYVIRSHRREKVRSALQNQGIASRVYYPIPVHRQPLHRGMEHSALPETDRACREVLALPLFPELRRQEFEKVCGALENI